VVHHLSSIFATHCLQEQFSMVNSTLEKEHDADPMPNASEAFYTNLFKQQHEKGVRMTNYEVDFLQDQTQWFAPYVDEVDGSEKWLGGMARAAAALNMSVQVRTSFRF
jgi:hypothetical protein